MQVPCRFCTAAAWQIQPHNPPDTDVLAVDAAVDLALDFRGFVVAGISNAVAGEERVGVSSGTSGSHKNQSWKAILHPASVPQYSPAHWPAQPGTRNCPLPAWHLPHPATHVLEGVPAGHRRHACGLGLSGFPFAETCILRSEPYKDILGCCGLAWSHVHPDPTRHIPKLMPAPLTAWQCIPARAPRVQSFAGCG